MTTLPAMNSCRTVVVCVCPCGEGERERDALSARGAGMGVVTYGWQARASCLKVGQREQPVSMRRACERTAIRSRA